MADNTAQGGTAVIAADDVTTLNGAASSAVLVQRVKPMFGPDNSARDVSGAYPLPVDEDPHRNISFYGRGCSFRIPGRAGTTGQNLFALHNATASPIFVDLERLTIDMVQTVIKAVTVLPPHIRLYRFTALPTGGAAIAKAARDNLLTSNAATTLWQDASADGTIAATALAVTTAGGVLTQAFAPRLITAAGYEIIDTLPFLSGVNELVTLGPLEGVVCRLEYTLATQNPVTDMWTVDCKWTEYTKNL
jgi:hypothetical protein